MALQTLTQEGYYRGSQTFLGNGSATSFLLTISYFDPLPTEEGEFNVYVDNVLQNSSTYSYASPPALVFATAPSSGSTISVELLAYDREYGNYQNIKLKDIVNNFLISYVGEDKIISKIKRTDVAFHAQRAVQELSYDTFRSSKSQEIEIPPSLTMPIPHDYVNYIKVIWIDDRGLEYTMFPARKTSNPQALLQDNNYNYIMDSDGNITYAENSETWKSYKANEPSEVKTDKDYLEERSLYSTGGRYGLTPEYTQDNGVFFVDQVRGRIHVSSNVEGKTIILHYISDGLAADGDTMIHKFAEEAVYKYIACAILSTRTQTPEYVIRRFKKERFAEIRKAKLRLSNLKTEELTQVMRGKSKVIKS